MAKVYSGLYEFKGHVVPYLVVVKCGTPQERTRPGNRGKRDSQILLMRFFNRVFFDLPMTPLELEMCHQIKNVIGVNPSLYEHVLMIDADTVVFPDSLARLVGSMNNDTKIIGICGETTLANAKSSWITMMQVYEYFISHHLTKAFESLFGSVTCLPGCFSMYRMRTPDGASGTPKPLLISNQIIDDYSINNVDTLHEKNLLHLGEDRYLTTLVLKHHPYYKNKFVAAAKCMTNAPDQLSVLLSQRRRWINSTVHNLFELILLPQLCGFCCFSMRFVVFIDLITTIIMPATLVYLAYLIYQLANPDSTTSYISLYLLAAIYGMQALIFILKRQWQHIGWMIVYLLAIPLFSFLIPIYAFWHFDDFSWGNTRVVVGESGRKHVYVVDNEKFDKSTIPMRKWSEYEQELLDDPKSQYAISETGSRFGGPAAMPNRPGSSTGNIPKSMVGYATSNYGTNSVYLDNGYGYNTMLNNNIINNVGLPGGALDYMTAGGTMSSNAYEMATISSPMGGTPGIGHMQMPMASSASIDPRFSQVGAGSPFFQQGNTMFDQQRLSIAQSPMPAYTGAQPMMVASQSFASPSYNSHVSPAGGETDPSVMVGHLDVGPGVFANYVSPPGSPSGAQLLPHQQWPSGVANEQLAARVAEIIATTDLMTITKKQVRQQIMTNFGISADEEKSRRDFINQCIAMELEKRQAGN
ncbi:chitin synthase-domain-containing protein [Coemansia spiralis]|nr:chitin synthase-domain-containing protein [Coemansia spiralis]